MVVLFQQDAENRDFFSNFSADGLHDGRTLLVIPLEFQEIKHQPFPMAQPNEKGAVSSPYCGSETNASPKKTRFRHSAWLFHLHNTVDIRPFVFPVPGSMIEAFCRLAVWGFKKQSINRSLVARPEKSPCRNRGLFHRYGEQVTGGSGQTTAAGLPQEKAAFGPLRASPSGRPARRWRLAPRKIR